MKLSVYERILIGNMIPEQAARFETLKLIREGREALSFSAEEIKALKLRNEGRSIKWDVLAAEQIGEVDIPLSDFFIGLISDELEKMNAAEPPLLTEGHFSIYEKFIFNKFQEE